MFTSLLLSGGVGGRSGLKGHRGWDCTAATMAQGCTPTCLAQACMKFEFCSSNNTFCDASLTSLENLFNSQKHRCNEKLLLFGSSWLPGDLKYACNSCEHSV